jgi:hypothetical protein
MDSDDQARLGGGDAASRSAIAARALAFDPAALRHHLAHLDMSEDAQVNFSWWSGASWKALSIARSAGRRAAARIAGDNRTAMRDRDGSPGSSDHPTHNDDETWRMCSACAGKAFKGAHRIECR